MFPAIRWLHDSNIWARDKYQVIGTESDGAFLQRNIVARPQSRCEIITQRHNQAIMDIGPEAGCFEIGIHSRKR
jgi:hypothetical protein